MIKSFLVLTCFLFLMTCSFLGYTQVAADTIRSENPELADTIVIYDEPVVISSQLEIYRPKVKKTKGSLLVSADGGVGFHYDYNDVCPDCIAYTDSVKSSSKNLLTYLYAIQLGFAKGNWLFGIAVGSYNQRTKFNYTDSGIESSVVNSMKTIDGKLSVGYWMGKTKKISVIPSLVFTLSKPYEISGKTYVKNSGGNTGRLEEVLNYNPLQYIIGAEVKAAYEVKKNWYITLAPSYNYDLKSIVSRTGPYTIQRHMLALRLGLMIGIK